MTGKSRKTARATSGGRQRAASRQTLEERYIAGVPARVMRPRLVFLSCLGALLAFGLLMVYSASSVEALKEYGSSTYFLERQAFFIVVGLAVMIAVSRVPLYVMRSPAMWWIWAATLVVLMLVLVVGSDAGGARRWIDIGFTQLQPSEFAKSVVIVTAAKIMYEFYEARSLDAQSFIVLLLASVCLPLIFIMLEPDFGSCVIIAVTVFVMCYFAGFSYKLIVLLLVIGGLGAAVLVLSSGYRSARILTASDPWADPYGDGYQAVLAIMAFASGGLTGRGIGNSTMKYNYLPEAHNDYILAIIGEELGFVVTIVFFAIVAGLVISAFHIASQSPTLQGRLIASGSAFLIALQFFINSLGILGVTPMTGKTLPFISYGGSSMIASLILMGLVLRVSLESSAATVHDVRRESIVLVDESTAGEPRVRSGSHAGFSVVDGASRPTAPARPSRRGQDGRPGSRSGSGAYERVNLGSDPADRLRSRGPRVSASRTGEDRRRGGASRGRNRNGR